MKTIYIQTSAAILFASSWSVAAQGTFQNLDFEQANPVPIVGSSSPPGEVTAASALPDWTVYIGNTQSGQVLYNDETLGTASVDLVSTAFGAVIDGLYSVILQSGADSPDGGPIVSASIAQSGLVPANAQSLQFKAASQTDVLSVSFEGNNLSPVVLGTGEGVSGLPFTLYGFSIAQYDGQVGQLEFTANNAGSADLDDITFSTESVPEPNTLELILMPATMIGLRRYRKQSKVMPS